MNRNDVKKKCSLRIVCANGSNSGVVCCATYGSCQHSWLKEASGEKRPIEDIYRTALMRRATLYNSIHRVLLPSVALPLAPSLPEGGNETSLNPFMGSKYPMHGWQANLKRTGAQPQGLGLYKKMKYPPFYGGYSFKLKQNLYALREYSRNILNVKAWSYTNLLF